MIATRRLRLIEVLAVVGLMPATAFAQGTIKGVVRDSLKRPIANAEVFLVESDRRMRTDSSGTFVFSDLAPGKYEIHARKIGFFPAETVVELVPRATKQLVFELDPRAYTLETINVTATCPRADMEGFYCRRQRVKLGEQVGVFMDEFQIDSAQPRFPIDLLRDIPGFRVEVGTGRGYRMKVRSFVGQKCIYTFVNGRIPDITNPPPVWPGEMIGMEVYVAYEDIPKEFKQYSWHTPAGPARIEVGCSLINYLTLIRPRYPAGSKPAKPKP